MNIKIKTPQSLCDIQNNVVGNYKKLGYLDSLRGIASVIVVISHLTLLYFPYLHNVKNLPIPDENYMQAWFHNSPFGFFYSGSSSVYVFFIMSGIVLSISNSHVNLIRLIFSRYARLAIPASCACVFAYLCMIIINNLDYATSENIYNNSFEINNPSLLNSIYYGAVRSIFHIKSAVEYNPVLWTMAIEFYGSVLLYISYKTKKPLLTMAIFSILFLMVNINSFIGIFCFFIGMNIAKLINLEKNNKLSIFLLIVGLYFSGVHVDSNSYIIFSEFLGKNTYTILNALSGVFIVSAIVINKNFKKALSIRSLQTLGKLSFPIYLVHWPVIYVISNVLTNNGIKNIPASIFIILTCVTLASVLFLKIDKISISLSKKIKNLKWHS